MKIILSIFLIMVLASCAITPFPKFPDIKEQYLIRVKGEQVEPAIKNAILNLDALDQSVDLVSCIKFQIVSLRPYQIKLIGVVDLKECNLIGGYKPETTQNILNWIDDVYLWADERKNCFKN